MHDPTYRRALIPSNQRERWDRGLEVGGDPAQHTSGMSAATYRRGMRVLQHGDLDRPDPEPLRTLIFRPNWDRHGRRYTHRFQVDHMVELQTCLKMAPGALQAGLALWDSFQNYELLDQASNGSAGSIFANNIQAERNRLSSIDPANAAYWQNCYLRFTVVIAAPAPTGQRWSEEEIERGDHIRVLERSLPPTPR